MQTVCEVVLRKRDRGSGSSSCMCVCTPTVACVVFTAGGEYYYQTPHLTFIFQFVNQSSYNWPPNLGINTQDSHLVNIKPFKHQPPCPALPALLKTPSAAKENKIFLGLLLFLFLSQTFVLIKASFSFFNAVSSPS